MQSVEFLEADATGNGNRGRLSACEHAQAGARRPSSIYGQELNYTAWWLAKMNLDNRGIGGWIEQGDTFHDKRLPERKADFTLANPRFNIKE